MVDISETDELLLEGRELGDGLVEFEETLFGIEGSLRGRVGEGVGKGEDVDSGVLAAEHGETFVAEGAEAVTPFIADETESETFVPKASEGFLHSVGGVVAVV